MIDSSATGLRYCCWEKQRTVRQPSNFFSWPCDKTKWQKVRPSERRSNLGQCDTVRAADLLLEEIEKAQQRVHKKDVVKFVDLTLYLSKAAVLFSTNHDHVKMQAN